MSESDSSIYDNLLFSFADMKTGDEVVKELKASNISEGYKIATEAVVIPRKEVAWQS